MNDTAMPTDQTEKKKPVRPKNSASLIVLRREGDEMTVLMGRRGRKAVFSDVYVFPGGKVDASDRRVGEASALAPDILGRLSSNPVHGRSFATAAVRETFEETGLLLADKGDIGTVDKGSWAEMGEMGLAPDLAKLTYVGHAITPSTQPARFNARFFMAWADDLQGELGGSGELADLAFLPLAKAKELPLVDVTSFMLEEIGRRSENDFAAMDGYPFFTYRGGKRYRRYR